MTVLRPQAGFTLLEVLIALALMALVTSGLFGAASLSERARQKTSAAAALLADRDGALDRLRGLIESAQPVRLPQDDGRLLLGFEGGPAHLSFFTLQPSAGLPPDLYRVDIHVREADGRFGLTASVASQARMVPPYDGSLVNGLGAARFAYFGARQGGVAQWHADWPAGARAPALIRLRFDESEVAQDMVMRPRLLPTGGSAP